MNVKHIWFQHGPASGWMDRLASILPHDGLVVNSHYTSEKQRQLENPFRFIIPRRLPIEKILLGTDIEMPSESEKTEFREQLIKTHHLSPDTFIISMLCRIQPWKGVHLLVEALEELQAKTLNRPIHAFIWGEAFNGVQKTYYIPQHKSGLRENDLNKAYVELRKEKMDFIIKNQRWRKSYILVKTR